MAGRIITFYSYKGGTGRTMALANAAVVLARDRGKEVLAIDWDLEAPGLHRFLHDGDVDERAGLVELFANAHELLPSVSGDGRAGTGRAQRVWRELSLDPYVGPTQVPGLSVMRAGRMDAGYEDRVSKLDWERVYHDEPELFSAFAARLAEQYDYVLVDSRTGVTDSGGICTMLLPDRLVLVFTPNRQSLDGVVARARAAAAYRSRSADLRPLVVYPLASRVELSEEELRREWRHGAREGAKAADNPYRDGYQPTFEALFREIYDLPECDLEAYFDDVQIQHASRFAYGEPIAVLEERPSDRLSLARSYVGFTRVLTDARAPWDAHATKVPAEGKPDREALREKAERRALLDEAERRIGVLNFEARRLRRREVQARLLEGLVVAAAVIAAFALSFSVGPAVVTPLLASGAALVGMIELYLRTWAPTSARLAMAHGAAALAREQTLLVARAGRYRETDQSLTRFVERVDEILAEVERVVPDVRSL